MKQQTKFHHMCLRFKVGRQYVIKSISCAGNFPSMIYNQGMMVTQSKPLRHIPSILIQQNFPTY